jgi:hypothetical protein
MILFMPGAWDGLGGPARCQNSSVRGRLFKYDSDYMPKELAIINITVLVVEAILFMPAAFRRD